MNLFGRWGKTLGLNWTVVVLSLARMADGIGNSILYVVIPLYVIQLSEISIHVPRSLLIGILISVYGFANAVLQPFMASWSDRVGNYKRLIEAGLLTIGAATLLFAWATRYLELFGLRIAQGLGLAMEIPPTLAILGIMTRKQTRGSAMGFYTTLRMIGLAVGPLIGGVLHDHFGFDAAFYTGAGILFVAFVLVLLGVEKVEAEPDRGGRRSPFDFSGLGAGLWSVSFATFVMASAFTLVTTLENEFNARLDIGAFGFSIAFSALMLGRLVSQVPLGRISDRKGRKPFVLVGMLLLAPATAYLGEVFSLFDFTAVRFIQGIASAAVVAPSLAYAGDVAEEGPGGGRSRQMSIVTIGFGLGIAFGPLMAGVLAVFFFELPFIFEGALCLLSAIVVFRYMTETVDKEKESK